MDERRRAGAGEGQCASGERSRVGVELTFTALLLGMLLAQLDTNIVVAALPTISTDLDVGPAIAGVTAAYLLAVTVMTPIAGKLGDVLGRRWIFACSIGVFAVGSLACAVADSMPLLTAARGLQGLGGAGLVVTAVSTLGQLFDRAELVRRQVWLTAVAAVSALLGPLMGGFIAALWGWPAIFLLNIPVCVVAAAIGLRGLPGRVGDSRLRDFDLAGTGLIGVVAGAVVLLGSFDSLATSPLWASTLVAVSAVGTVVFVARERRARDPLIPPHLFQVRGLARSITVTGLSGVALFGTFTFVPLAVIAGTGAPPTTASTYLVALTGGQLAITATFSLIARRHPQMAPWGRLGLGLGTVGLALLAGLPLLADTPSTLSAIVSLVGLVLAGAGLGLTMQAYTLLGIITAPQADFGSAMATLTFARQLGGSIGAATFGWVLIVGPASPIALTVVLGIAAVVLALGLAIAPNRGDEVAS